MVEVFLQGFPQVHSRQARIKKINLNINLQALTYQLEGIK